MNTVFVILVVLIVIASILLTIVVLLQSGKDGGLATNFVAGNQTLGVRQTANILEKVTWGLVAFVLVASIFSTFTLRGTGAASTVDAVTNEILNQTTDEAPAFPTIPQNATIPADSDAQPTN